MFSRRIEGQCFLHRYSPIIQVLWQNTYGLYYSRRKDWRLLRRSVSHRTAEPTEFQRVCGFSEMRLIFRCDAYFGTFLEKRWFSRAFRLFCWRLSLNWRIDNNLITKINIAGYIKLFVVLLV